MIAYYDWGNTTGDFDCAVSRFMDSKNLLIATTIIDYKRFVFFSISDEDLTLLNLTTSEHDGEILIADPGDVYRCTMILPRDVIDLGVLMSCSKKMFSTNTQIMEEIRLFNESARQREN